MNNLSVDGQHVETITLTGSEPELAFGYGVFETMRTYNGQVFLAEEHLNRLEQSANDIQLTLPQPRETIERWLMDHLQNYYTAGNELRVKMIAGEAHMYIISSVLQIPSTIYSQGVSVTYQELERTLPGTKQLAYGREYKAHQQAVANGFFEVLLLNHKQEVLEGSRSNIFIVRNDTIITPRHGMLHGITRNTVVELAGAEYEIEQRKIHFDELLRAEEVFITQTSTGVVPVVQIDQRKIGLASAEAASGKPGIVTKHVMELFEQFI